MPVSRVPSSPSSRSWLAASHTRRRRPRQGSTGWQAIKFPAGNAWRRDRHVQGKRPDGNHVAGTVADDSRNAPALAAHHIYATGSMRRATVSTILVSCRGLCIACHHSPFAQPSRGSPRGTVRCGRRPVASHEAEAGGTGEPRKAELFPCMHITFAIGRHRPAALAVQRVLRGELCQEFGGSPHEATVEAPSRPRSL